MMKLDSKCQVVPIPEDNQDTKENLIIENHDG
jgi:hypothetical protein